MPSHWRGCPHRSALRLSGTYGRGWNSWIKIPKYSNQSQHGVVRFFEADAQQLVTAVICLLSWCAQVTAIVVTTQRMFGLCGHDKAFNPLTTHDRLLEYARANSKSASPSREVLPTHVSTHTNPVSPEEGRPRRKRSLSRSSRISRWLESPLHNSS